MLRVIALPNGLLDWRAPLQCR